MADDENEDGIAEQEFEPAKEPKDAKQYLALINSAQKAGYDDYQDRCTNIEKRYADLERLANTARSREFQIFWANLEVLKPSIYSRPPVPVVTPRFKDRKPIPRMASEVLERATTVAFEQEDIDGVMRQVRDDLAIVSRGAVWLRYEAKEKDTFSERVCIEHVHRKDFLHDPARTWKEVDWVAKCSWLTKKEMRKRFAKASGDAYKSATYSIRKDDQDNDDGRLKAAVWELWSKSANKVVWVSPNVEKVLDEDKPHLKLEGFFPCPRPAYGTVQRGSLIPVPDYVQYKDQIEEINEITGRISALTESVKLRGFYPAGAGEIGDAIEAAIKNASDNQVLIPISNWAQFGAGSAKDTIIWLPLDMVATTITALIELRKQLIEDVYQITGLSDIMRGSTQASETLGAQELKSQYGSVRIRDRQDELVRIARDTVRLVAEIMAEEFQSDTLLEMSQVDMPKDSDIAKQVKGLEQQAMKITKDLQQAQQDPEVMQMAQQNPDKAQEVIGQAQAQISGIQEQIGKLKEVPTEEQVMKFLRDQKLRPFTLDIETDSTIAPDENAQKQRATEFITAVGGFMGQAIPLVQSVPQAAPLASEMLKYVANQFRAGRQMETTIEEFADQMKSMAQQPKPNPEADAAQAQAEAEKQRAAAEAESKAADQKMKQAKAEHDAKLKQDAAAQDAQNKKIQADITVRNLMAAGQNAAQKHQQDLELGALEIRKRQVELAKLQMPEAAETTEAKPPSESIAFKDLPPEGQAQMAEQAGIILSPQQMADHAAEQDAKKQAEALAKAKTGAPDGH